MLNKRLGDWLGVTTTLENLQWNHKISSGGRCGGGKCGYDASSGSGCGRKNRNVGGVNSGGFSLILFMATLVIPQRGYRCTRICRLSSHIVH